MPAPTKLHPRLDRFDAALAAWMEHWGHMAHRVTLAIVFVWFGCLKIAGVKTATSLLAHTVYWGDPATMVPLLGAWEAAIGLCLLFRRLNRLGLLLMAIRLPGTLLALVLLPEACFTDIPFAPTIEGQYLIKDAMLFAAALVIGGTVREEDADRPH